MQMSKKVYLAIPYSWNPEKSFEIANEVAAELMNDGHIVFSPVSHSHPIADYLDEKLRIDHDFWMNQDLPMLKSCHKLCVIVVGENGFDLIDKSSGCKKELEVAESLFMDIEYIFYQV